MGFSTTRRTIRCFSASSPKRVLRITSSKKTWRATFVRLLGSCSRIGDTLFQKDTGKSRKGTLQSAFRVFPLNIFHYEVCFADTAALGELASHVYSPSLRDIPSLPVWSRLHPDVGKPGPGPTHPITQADASTDDFDGSIAAVPPVRKKVFYKASRQTILFYLTSYSTLNGGICSLAGWNCSCHANSARTTCMYYVYMINL